MESCTYKSVQDKANILFTAKSAINVDDQAAIRVFINARYREFYEYFWWPEWTVLERRFFRQPWDASTAYLAGDQAYWWPLQTYVQALRSTVMSVDSLTSGGATTAVLVKAAGHKLTTGDKIVISGASPSVYNGTFAVTVVNATTATYVLTSNPGGNASGTITAAVQPVNASGQFIGAFWAECQPLYSGPDWVATQTYSVGYVVYNPGDGEFYQCITAHQNQEPPNFNYWCRLDPFERRLDYVGGNQGATATPLGRIRRAWDVDPRKRRDAIWRPIRLTREGVIVDGVWPFVWLEFRLRPNEFLGANWASGTAYTAGNTVYYPAAGDFYINIAATNSEPPTNASYWSKLEFPLVLRDAVAQAAMADMLKVAGQTTKYAAEMAEARRLLMIELDRIERQQGQTENLNVMTR